MGAAAKITPNFMTEELFKETAMDFYTPTLFKSLRDPSTNLIPPEKFEFFLEASNDVFRLGN